MKKLQLLKLWAVSLHIPLFVFEDSKVQQSIEQNDPHGCIDDMRRALHTIENHGYSLNEILTGSGALRQANNQLELVMLMR